MDTIASIPRRDRAAPLGFIVKLLATVIKALVIGALIAGVTELVQLWVIWPEEGLVRTERLLTAELLLINERVPFAVLQWLYWQPLQIQGLDEFNITLQALSLSLKTYLARLLVVLFSQHAVVLLSAALVVDGSILKDLRRVSAGIERSKLYHHAKARIFQLYAAPWLIYPCWPWPIEPNAIVLPFHLAFAMTLWAWISLYKKHF